jgi:hypothetical protein
MNKEWAKKGLNPVMYASKDSLSNFISGTELFEFVAKSNDITGNFEAAYNNTINTLLKITKAT